MRTAVSVPPFTDASTVVALAVEAEQAAIAPHRRPIAAGPLRQ